MSQRKGIAPFPFASSDLFTTGPGIGFDSKARPSSQVQLNGFLPGEEPDPREWNYTVHYLNGIAQYLDGVDLMNLRATPRAWDQFSLPDVAQVRSRYAIGWSGYRHEIYACGVVAGGTKYVMFSGDEGRTWSAVDLTLTGDPVSIAFSSGFTAASDRGYATTAGNQGSYWDGSDFSAPENPANVGTLTGVINTPGAVEEFTIFGARAASAGPGVWSSNGDPATQRTVPGLAGHTMRELVWAGAGAGLGFLGVSDDGATARLWTSPTGLAWTLVATAIGGAGVRIARDEIRGLWVRMSGSGTGVFTSPDGVTWSASLGGLPSAGAFPQGHRVDALMCRGGIWTAITRWSAGTHRPVLSWVSVDAGVTWDLSTVEVAKTGNAQVAAAWIGSGPRLAVASEVSMALSLRAR